MRLRASTRLFWTVSTRLCFLTVSTRLDPFFLDRQYPFISAPSAPGFFSNRQHSDFLFTCSVHRVPCWFQPVSVALSSRQTFLLAIVDFGVAWNLDRIVEFGGGGDHICVYLKFDAVLDMGLVTR